MTNLTASVSPAARPRSPPRSPRPTARRPAGRVPRRRHVLFGTPAAPPTPSITVPTCPAAPRLLGDLRTHHSSDAFSESSQRPRRSPSSRRDHDLPDGRRAAVTSPPPSRQRQAPRRAPCSSAKAPPGGHRDGRAGSASVSLTDVTPGAHSYTATFVPSDLERYVGSVSPTSARHLPRPSAKPTTTGFRPRPRSLRHPHWHVAAATGRRRDPPVPRRRHRRGHRNARLRFRVRGVNDLTRGTHHFTASSCPPTPRRTTLPVRRPGRRDRRDRDAASLTAAVNVRSVTLQASVSPTSQAPSSSATVRPSSAPQPSAPAPDWCSPTWPPDPQLHRDVRPRRRPPGRASTSPTRDLTVLPPRPRRRWDRASSSTGSP